MVYQSEKQEKPERQQWWVAREWVDNMGIWGHSFPRETVQVSFSEAGADETGRSNFLPELPAREESFYFNSPELMMQSCYPW